MAQFLDIGPGIPTVDGTDTHHVAQQVTPQARVLYVDHDPIVIAHAHQLLTVTPEGHTEFLHGDLCDVEGILDVAQVVLDFTRPVAVILGAVLHFEHACDPLPIVRRLVEALSPGGALVITHLAADIQPAEMAQLAASTPPNASYQFKMRTRGEVQEFFEGLELISPGVGPLDAWSDRIEVRPLENWTTCYHVGAGHKPPAGHAPR